MHQYRVEIFVDNRLRYVNCQAYCAFDAVLAVESQVKGKLDTHFVTRAWLQNATGAI